MIDPELCEMTDAIVCPYCGFADPDSFEHPNDGETACASCGERFIVSTSVSVCYSTAPIAADKPASGAHRA
jgi:DNA-directed RNA polymerase subunit RPC12/RpoP